MQNGMSMFHAHSGMKFFFWILTRIREQQKTHLDFPTALSPRHIILTKSSLSVIFSASSEPKHLLSPPEVVAILKFFLPTPKLRNTIGRQSNKVVLESDTTSDERSQPRHNFGYSLMRRSRILQWSTDPHRRHAQITNFILSCWPKF